MPGRPSMGSWVTYGLGTENANLPGFVVLCPGLPVLGHPLWSSTFLPGGLPGHVHQHSGQRSRQADPDIRNKTLSRECSGRNWIC